MAGQVDFVVVGADDSAVVAVEVAVVPIPVLVAVVVAVAVDGEDMIMAASPVVVLQVIVVLVFDPEERHHSVAGFHALLLEMYCSVYSAVEDAPAEVHPSALVDLDQALA